MTAGPAAATVPLMSVLRPAFLSRDGRLNLVWRITLYLAGWWVVFFVAAAVATVVSALFHWPVGGKNAVAAVVGTALLIGWTYLCRRLVDRRPWHGIGLTRPSQGVLMVLAGFLTGVLLVGAWFLIDLALGWVRVVGTEPQTGGLLPALGFLALGLLGNMGAGFLEEIGFRGYVLQNLAGPLPLWAAMPLMAVLFAFIVHFNKLSPVLVGTAILIAVLFGLTRLATGALWFAIGLHWAYDASQNYIYGLVTTAPPYGHALLHLQARGFLAASGGQDPVQLGVVGAGLLALALWMQLTGRLRWRWHLDDEGAPVPAHITK